MDGLENKPSSSNLNLPSNVPTLVEVKKILPRHVFQPDLLTSMYYVAKDFTIIITLFVSILFLEYSPYYKCIKYLAIPMYWYLQGTMFWAIFVLGHDCGHGSFSRHSQINDVIGTFLHR